MGPTQLYEVQLHPEPVTGTGATLGQARMGRVEENDTDTGADSQK